jgi:hypothetical protein
VTGPRVLAVVRQGGRALVRMAAPVAVVRVMVAVVGVWPSAALVALFFTVGAVAAWATKVEPRLFAPRFPELAPGEFLVHLDPPPGVEVDHLAFARALSAVADAYVEECRRQAGVVDEDGFV